MRTFTSGMILILCLMISPWSTPVSMQQVVLNGKIAFASNRDGNYEIYITDSDGSNQQRLTNNSGYDWYPNWSPNGEFIVFASNRDSSIGYSIYIMKSDGSEVTRLTSAGEHDDISPRWSPSGSRIAFSRQYRHRLDIYVVNADGTGLVNLTSGLDTSWNHMPAWSPDGSQIIFSTSRERSAFAPYDTHSSIYVMNEDGTDVALLRSGSVGFLHPEISSDNTRVTFYALIGQDYFAVLVMNRDGSSGHHLTPEDSSYFNPTWSPRGDYVAFESEGASSDIIVVNSDGTNFINLTNSPDVSDIHPTWQPILLELPISSWPRAVSHSCKDICTWPTAPKSS
jgi:Tol biopolymer transport system component